MEIRDALLLEVMQYGDAMIFDKMAKFDREDESILDATKTETLLPIPKSISAYRLSKNTKNWQTTGKCNHRVKVLCIPLAKTTSYCKNVA